MNRRPIINISMLPFTQQMQVHEAHVRGMYIAIACDHERLMDDLIVICERDRATEIKQYKTRYITHLEMGKKFDRSKKLLKAYNEQYFADFAPHFTKIGMLVKYRTILAHGYSSYDTEQKDASFIDFEYVYRGKEIRDRVYIQQFLAQLEDYRQSVIELAGLTVLLRKETGLL